MNKVKKIVLPIICALFVFSACVVKSNNAMDDKVKDFISIGSLIGGIVAIVWGGNDVHKRMNEIFWAGERNGDLPKEKRTGLALTIQPTLGVIKVAFGLLGTVFGLKSLVERNIINKKTKTIVVIDKKLKNHIDEKLKNYTNKRKDHIN
ncbi:DUF3185 family protein [bacterium]|nr:DUF3185 family protein [bacterium]